MTRRPAQHSDYVTCRHCRKDFRAITVRHLRNIHDYEGDHPVQDYKRRFRLPFASCREVRKKISVAKDAFWAIRGQHWTPAKLLDEIECASSRPEPPIEKNPGPPLRGQPSPFRLLACGGYKSWPGLRDRHRRSALDAGEGCRCDSAACEARRAALRELRPGS